MVEDEIDDLLELTGEDFYRSVEGQYGRNVQKILRYHDIDSYFILGGVNEVELFDVFEKPHDENSSEELISLKKEICNFTNEKILLKIGTKGKVVLLLKLAHDIARTRKAQSLSERKSNRSHKSRSHSTSTNSSSNAEINSETSYAYMDRSIMKLLRKINNIIHGVTFSNLSSDKFKIDISCTSDDAKPVCFIHCICGEPIRLYKRKNRYQLSNLSKHFKSTYNKENFIENNKHQDTHNSEYSTDMVVGDDNTGKEDESSFIDDIDNNYSSTVDNNKVDPTLIIGAKT